MTHRREIALKCNRHCGNYWRMVFSHPFLAQTLLLILIGQDTQKIENGRPFFKKYIPIIKKIAAASRQPVTFAHASSSSLRIERFCDSSNLFFTVRNNGAEAINSIVEINVADLCISENIAAVEMVSGKKIKTENNRIIISIPGGRTQVFQVK